MLWPEKRKRDAMFEQNPNDPGGGVDRPIRVLVVADGAARLPATACCGRSSATDGIEIGPIPKGFPVVLLANVDLLGADITDDREKREHDRKVREVIKTVLRERKAGRDIFESTDVLDGLWSLSKCPDFVVNQGHYFGTAWQTDEPAPSTPTSAR